MFVKNGLIDVLEISAKIAIKTLFTIVYVANGDLPYISCRVTCINGCIINWQRSMFAGNKQVSNQGNYLTFQR